VFIVPPEVAADHLLDPYTSHLNLVLRWHNHLAGPATRMRLRLAVHTGRIHHDDHGVAGPALVHLFRLLDAPAYKRFADGTVGDLTMIVADQLYTDATQSGGLINPAAYIPQRITSKETPHPRLDLDPAPPLRWQRLRRTGPPDRTEVLSDQAHRPGRHAFRTRHRCQFPKSVARMSEVTCTAVPSQ
jgi:hypothetical protein